MKKILSLAVVVASVSTGAMAENGIYGGIRFLSVDGEQSGTSVTADGTGAGAFIGYRYDILPEVFVQGDVGLMKLDGSTSSGTTTFNYEKAVTIGLGYEFNDDFYGVAKVSRNETVSKWNGSNWSDFNTGYGLAIGYYLTDQVAIEASYEGRDYPENWDQRIITVGLQTSF